MIKKYKILKIKKIFAAEAIPLKCIHSSEISINQRSVKTYMYKFKNEYKLMINTKILTEKITLCSVTMK